MITVVAAATARRISAPRSVRYWKGGSRERATRPKMIPWRARVGTSDQPAKRRTDQDTMKIHMSADARAWYWSTKTTTVATATRRVSENARHATTPLESVGCRARRSRNPAQRVGQAETKATTPIHARRTHPERKAEPGRETIH